MTDFITNAALGATAPLVAKDKGDLSNRLNCAGAHIKNNAQTLAQDTVVIGGTAIAARAVAKNKNLADKFCNVVSKVTQKTVGTINKVLPNKVKDKAYKCFNKIRTRITGGDLIGKINKLSTKQKGAIGILMSLGALALGYVGYKHIYKAGQIDQKYTDKAAIEKHTKSPLE